MKQTIVKSSFHYSTEESYNSLQCELSVYIGTNCVGLCVNAPHSTNAYYLAWYSSIAINVATLNEIYWQHAELRLPYKSVTICYDGTSLLVPAHLHLSTEESEALWQMKDFNAGAYITCKEDVTIWQSQLYYGVEESISTWIQGKWPAHTPTHVMNVLLKNGQLTSSSTSINVYILPHTILVTASNKGQLILAQDYQYTTKEDVVFYVLKICEAWNLDPENVELKLSGLINEDSQLYKELYLYVRNIGFATDSFAVGDYPSHFFLLLKWIAQCVS